MREWIIAILLSGAALTPGAAGCSCIQRKPFCEVPPASADSEDSVVFVGTVEALFPETERARRFYLNAEPAEVLKHWGSILTQAESEAIRKNDKDDRIASAFRWNKQMVRLRVDEAFVGKPGVTFELLSGLGECCDCSVGFKAGEQYFVVASRYGTRWSTSGCEGTTLAKYAPLEVAALRAWKRGARMAPAIEGSVIDVTRVPGKPPGQAASPTGLKVKLSGQGIEREVQTEAGRYLFEGLKPGKYQVSLAEPGWLADGTWNPLVQTIDLSTRACARNYFSVKREQSEIRGRLPGAPAGFSILAYPVNDQKSTGLGRVAADGSFTITQLEPGEYVIGHIGPPVNSKSPTSGTRSFHSPYPPTFYPGVPTREAAQVIRLERRGQVFSLADWPLPPPRAERKVTGTVRWVDGGPVAGALVFLTPAQGLGVFQRSSPTAADGSFTIWGFEGVDYRLAAATGNPSDSRNFAFVGNVPLSPSGESVVLSLKNGTPGPPPFPFTMEFHDLNRQRGGLPLPFPPR